MDPSLYVPLGMCLLSHPHLRDLTGKENSCIHITSQLVLSQYVLWHRKQLALILQLLLGNLDHLSPCIMVSAPCSECAFALPKFGLNFNCQCDSERLWVLSGLIKSWWCFLILEIERPSGHMVVKRQHQGPYSSYKSSFFPYGSLKQMKWWCE